MQSEALGMPAPGRCLVSAWRRSWPLLWGGSPWDTRSCRRAFIWGAARPSWPAEALVRSR